MPPLSPSPSLLPPTKISPRGGRSPPSCQPPDLASMRWQRSTRGWPRSGTRSSKWISPCTSWSGFTGARLSQRSMPAEGDSVGTAWGQCGHSTVPGWVLLSPTPPCPPLTPRLGRDLLVAERDLANDIVLPVREQTQQDTAGDLPPLGGSPVPTLPVLSPYPMVSSSST